MMDAAISAGSLRCGAAHEELIDELLNEGPNGLDRFFELVEALPDLDLIHLHMATVRLKGLFVGYNSGPGDFGSLTLLEFYHMALTAETARRMTPPEDRLSLDSYTKGDQSPFARQMRTAGFVA